MRLSTPFQFSANVFLRRQHIPYSELPIAKTELLVIPVQKQVLKKGIQCKVTFFFLKER